ncbi:hypothetical protein [Falsirhodobacter sp. alg1]|uniref:hypothetical protein n=1 Tax=Falsirhodobacter sp. alg1 TaxID=1472418 RepID=UPI0005EDB18C|nr:hypothetical protein [Falsirhodobacter sp. alg1]
MRIDCRIIELENEMVALRRATVSVVKEVVADFPPIERQNIVTRLLSQAEAADPAEARLLRLVAESLRRG